MASGFDQVPGSLFVARVAGHLLEPFVALIASRLAREADESLDEHGAIRANVRVTVAEMQAYLQEVAPGLAELVTVRGAVKALDTGEVSWVG